MPSTISKTWKPIDSNLPFDELVNSLLQLIPIFLVMEVDHHVHRTGYIFTTLPKGWLVLWVQLHEDNNLRPEKIEFDYGLKRVLMNLAEKDGRYLEYTSGRTKFKFLFEFTGQPVDFPPAMVRFDKGALREVSEEPASQE